MGCFSGCLFGTFWGSGFGLLDQWWIFISGVVVFAWCLGAFTVGRLLCGCWLWTHFWRAFGVGLVLWRSSRVRGLAVVFFFLVSFFVVSSVFGFFFLLM